ncbi:MAG: hypothetical protein VXX31_14605, partial [Planctomycetota bacterium]|nr:hypothetical protein [Planctomycetota bacterium]
PQCDPLLFSDFAKPVQRTGRALHARGSQRLVVIVVEHSQICSCHITPSGWSAETYHLYLARTP